MLRRSRGALNSSDYYADITDQSTNRKGGSRGIPAGKAGAGFAGYRSYMEGYTGSLQPLISIIGLAVSQLQARFESGHKTNLYERRKEANL